MKKDVHLFKEKLFGEMAQNRLAGLVTGIKRMPDDKVIKSKDNLVEAVAKITKDYEMKNIALDFTAQSEPKFARVPLRERVDRIYVEYNIPIKGNAALINVLCEANSYYNTNFIVQVLNDTMSVSLDTGFHNSFELPQTSIDKVKKQYDILKEYVKISIDALSIEIDKLNAELPILAKKLLEERIIEIEKLQASKNRLKFD